MPCLFLLSEFTKGNGRAIPCQERFKPSSFDTTLLNDKKLLFPHAVYSLRRRLMEFPAISIGSDTRLVPNDNVSLTSVTCSDPPSGLASGSAGEGYWDAGVVVSLPRCNCRQRLPAFSTQSPSWHPAPTHGNHPR